jgi:hypothetical protein
MGHRMTVSHKLLILEVTGRKSSEQSKAIKRYKITLIKKK